MRTYKCGEKICVYGDGILFPSKMCAQLYRITKWIPLIEGLVENWQIEKEMEQLNGYLYLQHSGEIIGDIGMNDRN